jgi:hypothetical protein
VNEVIQKVLNHSLIQVEASPLTPETIQQLGEIPGITHVNQTTNNGAQTSTIELVVNEQDDEIRPLVSGLIVNSGAKLYTIKQGENMLERAYIEALREKDGDKL